MKMNKFKTDYYIYGGGKFYGKETFLQPLGEKKLGAL